MENLNAFIINIVKNCILAYNACSSSHKCQSSIKYIMGQAIRQYIIPDKNWHVSQNAYDLWNKLTDGMISDYSYREPVSIKAADNNVGIYIGNEKTPRTKGVVKGAKIPYNSLFHDEHTIPVCNFVDQLLKMRTEDLTDQKIANILDAIHICKITKEEDRNINCKSKRSGSFEDIVQNVYCNSVSTLRSLPNN